jgi:hypothetical protein
MQLRRDADKYSLIEPFTARLVDPQQEAKDAGLLALLRMIDFVTSEKVRPTGVSLPQQRDSSLADYAGALECPVTFGVSEEVWTFAAADVEARLTGAVPDVADATDRIAEDYIASLSQHPATAARRRGNDVP